MKSKPEAEERAHRGRDTAARAARERFEKEFADARKSGGRDLSMATLVCSLFFRSTNPMLSAWPVAELPVSRIHELLPWNVAGDLVPARDISA